MKKKIDFQWVIIVLVGIFFLFRFVENVFSSDEDTEKDAIILDTTKLNNVFSLSKFNYPELGTNYQDPFLKNSPTIESSFEQEFELSTPSQTTNSIPSPISNIPKPFIKRPDIVYKGFVKDADGNNFGIIYLDKKRYFIDKGDSIKTFYIMSIDDTFLKIKEQDSIYQYTLE